MTYRYYCNECGFEAVTDFSYSASKVNSNSLICPECGEGRLIEEKVEGNNEDLIEKMRDTIEKVGANKVWKEIEKEADPLNRIADRELFFRAGGKLV